MMRSPRRPHAGAPARLIDERVGKRVRTFRLAGLNRTAMTIAGSEHLGLPEVFPQLESVDVYMGWFGRWTLPVRAVATLSRPPRANTVGAGRSEGAVRAASGIAPRAES